MRVLCIRLAITVTFVSPAASTLAELVPCLESAAAPTRRPATELLAKQTMVLKGLQLEPLDVPLVTSHMMASVQHPFQQVDVDFATGQGDTYEKVQYSTAEKQRQAQSGPCAAAYKSLIAAVRANGEVFDSRAALAPQFALNSFFGWYFAPENRDKQTLAAPIVAAERAYARDCLTGAIPPEMNPNLVKGAVGILSFEGQPFCTVLRASEDSLFTDKHCFLYTETGELRPQTKAALSSQGGKIVFQYEGEPDTIYEVCPNSLPRAASTGFLPEGDVARVKTAKTKMPVSPWRWTDATPTAGTSLYMRGYFEFAPEAASLQRMRSTALGGCAVIGSDPRDRCVFNGCQAVGGMSGAPVFKRPEPGAPLAVLEVVGLHLGPATLVSHGTRGGASCSNIDGKQFSSSNLAFRRKGE